jgi:hypothetical protein
MTGFQERDIERIERGQDRERPPNPSTVSYYCTNGPKKNSEQQYIYIYIYYNNRTPEIWDVQAVSMPVPGSK